MLKYINYMEITISNTLAFRKIIVTRVSMIYIYPYSITKICKILNSKQNQKLWIHVTIRSWYTDILKCDLPVLVDF
jgi:hypothetical protein